MAPAWFLFPLFCISFLFFFLKKNIKNDRIIFGITFVIFVIAVHYRNVLQKIEWNSCAIITNLAIGLFLYTCGYLYYHNEFAKEYIEKGKYAFDFFVVSIILLCEAKYYWNYYIDLRAGIISNGKWMLVTCISGIYFLLYFSTWVVKQGIYLKRILIYVGRRSMSIMFFHILSFNIFTLIGIYILHDTNTVSWTNALYGKWYYGYINAFIGITVPLIFGYLLEKAWNNIKKLKIE